MIIISAIIAFVLGIKVGKGITYTEEGFTPSDRETINSPVVDMQSKDEESASEIIKSRVGESEEGGDPSAAQDGEQANKENIKKTHQQLKAEFDKLKEMEPGTAPDPESLKKDPTAAVEKVVKKNDGLASQDSVATDNQGGLREKYIGKYTIQLGSHRTLEESKNFADGFRHLGYNAIINEVDLPGKGVWYRTSLGAFNTVAEAKDYVKEKESLFQGQDYVIVKIN